MHRLMDESCSNCNKFSHCNNNGLICVSRYRAKEQECEELKFTIKHTGLLDLMNENVQLRKALDKIEINIAKYQGLTLGKPRTMRENDCIYNIQDIINKAKEK